MPEPGAASADEVHAKIVGILERETGIPAGGLTRDMRLHEGLGLTSMEVFRLMCDIEEEFSVHFGGDEVRGLGTFGRLVDATMEKVRAGR